MSLLLDPSSRNLYKEVLVSRRCFLIRIPLTSWSLAASTYNDNNWEVLDCHHRFKECRIIVFQEAVHKRYQRNEIHSIVLRSPGGRDATKQQTWYQPIRLFSVLGIFSLMCKERIGSYGPSS